MKIVHVITRSDEIGGAQIHLKDLSVSLNHLGHHSIVLAGRGGDERFFGMLAQVGVTYDSLEYLVRPIDLFADIRAVFELAKKLQKIAPDVVTAHSFKAGLIARLACLVTGKRCIFTAHGWSFIKCASSFRKGFYIFLERCLSMISFKIITVCEDDRQFAIRSRICSEKRIAMIHNGIPDIEDKPTVGCRDRVPRIIMVARFDWPKDHISLLKALSELKAESWTLDLVGDGPYMENVRRFAQESQLTNRVQFLGRCADIAKLLKDSDIFVLTSHSEGFPLSIIEAMRASLPVVATNTGGISEAVIDEETGFVVEDLDYVNLKEKLLRLINDEGMRRQMGFAGRRRYLKLFTLAKMIESTVSVYEKAVSV